MYPTGDEQEVPPEGCVVSSITFPAAFVIDGTGMLTTGSSGRGETRGVEEIAFAPQAQAASGWRNKLTVKNTFLGEAPTEPFLQRRFSEPARLLSGDFLLTWHTYAATKRCESGAFLNKGTNFGHAQHNSGAEPYFDFTKDSEHESPLQCKTSAALDHTGFTASPMTAAFRMDNGATKGLVSSGCQVVERQPVSLYVDTLKPEVLHHQQHLVETNPGSQGHPHNCAFGKRKLCNMIARGSPCNDDRCEYCHMKGGHENQHRKRNGTRGRQHRGERGGRRPPVTGDTCQTVGTVLSQKCPGQSEDPNHLEHRTPNVDVAEASKSEARWQSEIGTVCDLEKECFFGLPGEGSDVGGRVDLAAVTAESLGVHGIRDRNMDGRPNNSKTPCGLIALSCLIPVAFFILKFCLLHGDQHGRANASAVGPHLHFQRPCDCNFDQVIAGLPLNCSFSLSAMPEECPDVINTAIERYSLQISSLHENQGVVSSDAMIRFGKRNDDESLLRLAYLIDNIPVGSRPAQRTKVALLFRKVAEVFMSLEDPAQAVRLYNKSAQICEKGLSHEENLCAGESFIYLGYYWLFFHHDTVRAVSFLDKAEAKYKRATVGSDRWMELLEVRALLEQVLGNYWKAENMFEKVLQFRRQHYSHGNPELADALLNLGINYDQKAEYAKANPYFNESMKIRTDTDKCEAIESYYTLKYRIWHYRHMFFQEQKVSQNLRNGLRSITENPRANGTLVASQSAMCLGDLSFMTGDLHEPKKMYRKSLQYCRASASCTIELEDSILRRIESHRSGVLVFHPSQLCTWEARLSLPSVTQARRRPGLLVKL